MSPGARIAPPRFLLFLGLLAAGVPVGIAALGWTCGTMAGFDVAAALFLASCIPLLGDEAEAMRRAARRNDANRALLLAVSGVATLAVLAAVGAELGARGAPEHATVALVIATLALAWSFGTVVYALHYAHLYYLAAPGGGDARGLDVPDADAPDYSDFLYFAATMAMTFQTSDVTIRSRAMRRIALAQGGVAFLFNLGVIAFTVNVLGG